MLMRKLRKPNSYLDNVLIKFCEEGVWRPCLILLYMATVTELWDSTTQASQIPSSIFPLWSLEQPLVLCPPLISCRAFLCSIIRFPSVKCYNQRFIIHTETQDLCLLFVFKQFLFVCTESNFASDNEVEVITRSLSLGHSQHVSRWSWPSLFGWFSVSPYAAINRTQLHWWKM